jgi:hypothetical protein
MLYLGVRRALFMGQLLACGLLARGQYTLIIRKLAVLFHRHSG